MDGCGGGGDELKIFYLSIHLAAPSGEDYVQLHMSRESSVIEEKELDFRRI